MHLLAAGADVNETISLSNFAFLYGTFPSAPGVFVYALQYDVAVQMVSGQTEVNDEFDAYKGKQ